MLDLHRRLILSRDANTQPGSSIPFEGEGGPTWTSRGRHREFSKGTKSSPTKRRNPAITALGQLSERLAAVPGNQAHDKHITRRSCGRLGGSQLHRLWHSIQKPIGLPQGTPALLTLHLSPLHIAPLLALSDLFSLYQGRWETGRKLSSLCSQGHGGLCIFSDVQVWLYWNSWLSAGFQSCTTPGEIF